MANNWERGCTFPISYYIDANSSRGATIKHNPDFPHMSFIYKLKANFCGRKKEGHFHYKNFSRALK